MTNNLTLFLAILLTSIITHILTISMIPPSSPYHQSFLEPPSIRRSNHSNLESTMVTLFTSSSDSTKRSNQLAAIDGEQLERDRHEEGAGDAVPAPKMANEIYRNTKLPFSQPSDKAVASTADKRENRTDRVKSNVDDAVSKNTIETTPNIPASQYGKVVMEQVEIQVDQESFHENRVEPITTNVDPSADKSNNNLQETVRVPESEQGSLRTKEQSIGGTETGKGPDMGAERSKSIQPIEMAPLGQSKWIGNDWYPPPGGKLYDGNMLKHLFGKVNILWVGDAELLQLYTALMAILHSEDAVVEPTSLDGKWGQPCKTDMSLTACLTFTGVKLDFTAKTCLREIRELIANRDVSKYDVVIVNYGLQEMHGLCPFVISDKPLMFADVVNRLKKLPVPVAWTTMAWLDFNIISVNVKVTSVIDKEKCNVSLFDYGSGMQQRKETIEFNKRRKKLSYSMTARMAYIQMLANHLNQQFPHR